MMSTSQEDRLSGFAQLCSTAKLNLLTIVTDSVEVKKPVRVNFVDLGCAQQSDSRSLIQLSSADPAKLGTRLDT